MSFWLSHTTKELQRTMSEPWPGEANLVGTMVDRKGLRIAGAGEHVDDAILVFLQSIRHASNTTSIFDRLWKTIRPDRTVDMWLYDHQQQWRSVSFEVQFHPLLEDLIMWVSTFVPFGVGEDRSNYPIERSDDYIRPTQTLHAKIAMQARRMSRSTHQGQSVEESSHMGSEVHEAASRLSFGSTTANTHRSTHTGGHGVDRTKRGVVVLDSSCAPYDHHETDRHSKSDETTDESRYERSHSTSSERSNTRRDSSESSQRKSSMYSMDDLVELTEDVSFAAIGPDFTQPDRLYSNWRSNPGTGEASLTIDMVNFGLPTLGRLIEQGVSHRRMSRRALRQGPQVDFWTEAAQLIAPYQPAAFGQRVVLEHDGLPQPIRPADMAAAIQEARGGLGQLIGRSHFLPPAR